MQQKPSVHLTASSVPHYKTQQTQKPGKNTAGAAGGKKLKIQPGGKRPENKSTAGRQRHNVNKINVNKVNVKVNVNKVNDKVNDIYSMHSHYKGNHRRSGYE